MTADDPPALRISGRTRSALVVLAGCLFVSLTCELFPVGAQSELAAGLATTRSQIGLLVTWYAIAAAIATLPGVLLTRRLDPRVALAGGMMVLGVCQVGFSTSHGVLAAGLWRAGSALTHGLVWSQAPVFGARLMPPSQQGRATALVLLGASLGLLAGAPLATALVRGLGWRTASALLGSAAVLAAAVLVVTLPRAAPAADPDSGSHPPRPRWAPVLAVCAATVVLVIGHYVSYAFLEPLSARAGLGGRLVVGVLAAYGAAGLVGVRLVGRSLDVRPLATALVGCALLAVGVLGTASTVPAITLVAVLGWGAAAGALPVWLNTAALRADPDRPDVASGAYVVAYQIGISAGAALGAGLLAVFSLGLLPIVSALVVALGTLVVLGRRAVFASR